MKKLNSKELREQWISFYEERNHKNIGAVSLIGDGTTGVLFNVAGMQPLMPYLLGKTHPLGKRLCNVQGCVRTNDIDSVGDSSHATFFEMMGSWSLGDYFKEERCKWSYDLFTNVLEIPRDRLATTCFEGDENAPRDDEAAAIKEKVGFKKENIYFLPKSDNWWEIESGPCGPDSEYFYITDVPKCSDNCNPSCDCGHFIEIGNDVFMQYEKIDKDKYIPLKNKNVDTGWGFERILAFLNTEDGDIYKTDLYTGAMNILEDKLGIKYNTNKDIDKSIRIILDHTRTATMLLGDEKHLTPSNVGAGYILRRLIRRAIRHAKKLNLDINTNWEEQIATLIIEKYAPYYEELTENKNVVLEVLKNEKIKFERTLNKGLKEFEKVSSTDIDGQTAFRLFDTYGFPIELTEELAREKGLKVDVEGFKEKFRAHQELSRTASQGKFKGGLSSGGEMQTKYHTATHLLNAALKIVVNEDVHQKGSNITEERMRFDFSCDHKLTDEEKQKTEELVNKWIQEGLEVTVEEMSKQDAIASGAECMFIEKYPDIVTVYKIGEVSKELCGGPHVKNTNELGKFKITKEEASSAGVRRIKAILE